MFYTAPDVAFKKIQAASSGEMVLLARTDDGTSVKAQLEDGNIAVYIENADGLMDELNVMPDETEVECAVAEAYKWFSIDPAYGLTEEAAADEELTPAEFQRELDSREAELDDMMYDLISSILFDNDDYELIITDDLIQEVKNAVLSIMGWKYKIGGIYRPTYIPDGDSGGLKPSLHPYDEYVPKK